MILDLVIRKVVGWSMRDHLRAEPTIAALTLQSNDDVRARGSFIIPIAVANMPPAITAASYRPPGSSNR